MNGLGYIGRLKKKSGNKIYFTRKGYKSRLIAFLRIQEKLYGKKSKSSQKSVIDEKIREILPYLMVIAFTFYLLPFFIKDTGSGMFILLVVIPIICFIISVIYGIKKSFDWLYPLLIMLLFVPTIFIFYNESATIYILLYGIISLVGNFLGSLIFKKNK